MTVPTNHSYPLGSLKSELCIKGRDLLYDRCKKLGIDYKQTQKVSVGCLPYNAMDAAH